LHITILRAVLRVTGGPTFSKAIYSLITYKLLLFIITVVACYLKKVNMRF